MSITDNDDPAVTASFGSATYSVAESDDADTTEVTENEVTATVTLSADPERTVTISLSKTDQGGATSADYSGVPADVTFNSGDTSKTFTFTATHDTVDDDGENVKLTFGTLPAGVGEGTTNETVVSINDDDVPEVTVSYGASTYTVAEGGTVTVKVKLSADPERTVEVPIVQEPFDGASSADYSGVPATVTFNAGDTEKTFTFSATQETVDDDGEKVKLTFGTLPTRVASTGPSQAIVSITDNDDPAVTASFRSGTYAVAESDDADTSNVTENEVAITVTLSADPERTVTISLSKADQDGESSADYSGVPGTVVFTSGDTSESFTFAATADDGESVKLSFGTLPTGVTGGTTTDTVISIDDDDVATVTATFAKAAHTVEEADDADTPDVKEN